MKNTLKIGDELFHGNTPIGKVAKIIEATDEYEDDIILIHYYDFQMFEAEDLTDEEIEFYTEECHHINYADDNLTGWRD